MSHTFKSAAAFYSAANGKRVRKQVTGVATAEQWPAMAANIRSQLLAQGASEADIQEDADKISVRTTGQFWLRPKVIASECGIMTVRSADYLFIPECGRTGGSGIYGDKKGGKIEGAALVKRYDNGMAVTFTIEECAA